MTFRELVTAVKDETLPAEKLEEYRDKIVEVVAEFQLELSDLQKKEALFMGAKQDGQSVADRKIDWKVTEAGQRMIDLKNWLSTGKILIKSLQNRYFGKIR